MKNVIVYFLIVIIVVCICCFKPIENTKEYDYGTASIQTYQVEILHLDVETVSNNEKVYYASVIDRKNDFSVVVEIPEARYVSLKIGDNVALQKETFHSKNTEEIRYSIVGDTIHIKDYSKEK